MSGPEVFVGSDHYQHVLGGPMTASKCYQLTVGTDPKTIAELIEDAVPSDVIADDVKNWWIDPENEVRITFDAQDPVVPTLGVRLSRDVLMVNQRGLLDTMKLRSAAPVKVNLHLFS